MFQSEDENSLIKIIDIGLAKSLQNTKKIQNKRGTTLYMAPEVIKEDYNEKCDVWSCGILFYLLFMKTYPFNDESSEKLEKKILEGKKMLVTVPHSLRDSISIGRMSKRPKKTDQKEKISVFLTIKLSKLKVRL